MALMPLPFAGRDHVSIPVNRNSIICTPKTFPRVPSSCHPGDCYSRETTDSENVKLFAVCKILASRTPLLMSGTEMIGLHATSHRKLDLLSVRAVSTSYIWQTSSEQLDIKTLSESWDMYQDLQASISPT